MNRQKIEAFINQIWYPSKDMVGAYSLQVLFWPLSLIYRWIIWGRYHFYKVFPVKKQTKIPVIVVGNITVGGTGKTPFVIYLSELLKKQGFHPGIISRGYGRKDTTDKTRAVTDTATALQVGDEPLLIRQKTMCPVVVGNNRNQSIEYIEQHYPDVDIIISDDGLQHYAMARDIEIVLLDGERLLGNEHCLPAGPLREPKIRLKKVDFIVVKNGSYPNGIKMEIQTEPLVNLKEPTKTRPLKDFLSHQIHAVSGIGHVQGFFQLLTKNGLNIEPHAFSDHHQFKVSDFLFDNQQPIIMTEKDAIKCQPFAKDNYWMLPIKASLPYSFETDLLRKIQNG